MRSRILSMGTVYEHGMDGAQALNTRSVSEYWNTG